MHQLKRNQAPTCLAKYRHGRDNWDNVTSADKADIWIELEAMQGKRCAYCEIDISNSDKQIEHFHQKGRNPQLTFQWGNLFGSCKNKDRCGDHKDNLKPVYQPQDLIKPDIEDPEKYLVFLPDGSVRPRKRLSPADEHRAKETIRIFNLNGALKQIRFSEIQGYVQYAEELAEMASQHPAKEWLPLVTASLEKERIATKDLPFATAIWHVLTRQSP